jgi:hypothetical protein
VIPVLLWRCSICAVDDGLRHRARWRRPDRLWCVNCRTTWEVRRVLDGDYQLRVTAGEAPWLGHEAPLADWYDRMKAGLKLIPISDPSLELAAGEVLWAKSKRAKLLREVPLSTEIARLYFSHENLGPGQLFSTNQRLIWKGTTAMDSFWLRQLQAVYTVGIRRLIVQYDGQIYKMHFAEESCLKWLTYIALAVQQLEEVDRSKIWLSHY